MPRAVTPGSNGGLGVNVAGVPQPFTATGNNKDGYTVGAGLEYMFAPNWSAKAEYQYYNFGSTTFTSGPADVVGVAGPGRRAYRQGRCELPLRLGRTGGLALLTPNSDHDLTRAGSRRPFVCLALVCLPVVCFA